MRDTLTSPRVEDMKRKRRMRRIRLLILFSVFFISSGGALAYFSSNSHITIHAVTVTGTQVINGSDVESQVRSDLSGKYIHLFARSNSFIYPRKKIYADILAQFPRIDTLSVYRDTLTTLHITITERAGSYLYCGATVPEAASDVGENCYFVNNDGYIFDKAPYFSGDVYFKYYLALADADSLNPLGTQMLPSDSFHALTRFIDGVISLGFKPTYLIMGNDGTNTLYLNHDKSVTTPTIIFKNDSDLSIILDNLSTAMTKPEFANEINSKYSTLLYIDLRFNNKVVYKFQQ
jgi:hypothetical protein